MHHEEANSKQTQTRQKETHPNKILESDNPAPAKMKQRKTAIALSAITCLFLFVMGYEILRDNQNDHVKSNIIQETAPRPLAILGGDVKNKESFAYEGEMSKQLRLLKAQNRLQNQKIRDLKQELHAATLRLHELSLTMLDKRHTVDLDTHLKLQRELKQKEERMQDLQGQIANVQDELEGSRQKAHHMQLTIEALAAMTETHKKAKENAEVGFKDHIQKIHTTAEEDRNELIRSIQSYEERMNQVLADLEKRSMQVAQLEQALQQQNQIIQGQSKEMQTMANSHNASQEQISALSEQLQSIQQRLHQENQKSMQLENELDIARNQYAEELKKEGDLKQKIENAEQKLAALENDLKTHKETLEGKKLEIDLLSSNHEAAKSDLHLQLAQLKDDLNQEMTRSSTLLEEINTLQHRYEGEQQNAIELEKQLNRFQKELAHKSHNLSLINDTNSQFAEENKALKEALTKAEEAKANLEQELKAQYAEAIEKIQELQTVSLGAAWTDEDSKAKILELQTALQAENERAQELKTQLDEAMAFKEATLQNIASLETELNLLKSKTQELNETNLQLIHDQLDMAALTDKHSSLYQEQLTEARRVNLENEQQLKKELFDAVNQLNQEKANAQQLQNKLQETTSFHEQAALNAAALQKQLEELANNHAAEKEKASQLQNDLDKTIASANEHETRASELQKQLEELANNHAAEKEKASLLQNDLDKTIASANEHETRASELQKQLEELANNHAAEKEKASLLQKDLDKKNASASEREMQASELQMELLAALNEAQEGQHAVKLLQERVLDLTKSLEEKEREMAIKEEKTAQLEKSVGDLQANLEADQQELRAALSKYSQEKLSSEALEQKIMELAALLAEKEDMASRLEKTRIAEKEQADNLYLQSLSDLADREAQVEELRATLEKQQHQIEALKQQPANEIAEATIPSVQTESPSNKPEETPKAAELKSAEHPPLTGIHKITFANGDVYEGDFVNGQRTGKGTYTAKSGAVYEGDFVNGVRTGKGKLTLPNGMVYEGDFVNGKANGQGKLITKNGDVYVGKFVDGKPSR